MLWIISLTRVLLNLTPVSLFSCIPFQPSLSLVFSLGTSSCAFGLRGGPLSCDLAHPSAHTNTHTHTHTHTHIVRALSEPKCTWRTHTRLYSLLWQPTATVHTYCDTLIIQRRCTEGIMSCTFCSHSFLTPSRASSIHALRAPRILPDTLSARFCAPFRPKASLYVTLRSLIRCVTSPVKTSLLVPDPFFFFLVSALLPLRGGSCPLTLILELALRTQLTQKVLSHNELAQWTSFHGRCVTEQVELESYGVMEGLVKKDSLWDGDVCL